MDPCSSSLDLSAEEITWLHASAFLDEPPAPPPKDDDVFIDNLSLFSSSRSTRYPSSSIASRDSPRRASSLSTPPRSVPGPQNSPRSEWLYRRPKTPPSARHRSSDSSPYLRSSNGCIRPMLSCNGSTVSVHTTIDSSKISSNQESSSSSLGSSSSGPFWTTILRTRSRSERSIPLLKTIPSESQITLNAPDLSTSKISTSQSISTPKMMSTRPPSISSTLSSVSNSPSPSSSRSESPVTPVSLSSYDGGAGRYYHRQSPYHRRHRTQPDSDSSFLSSSCPPSRSILTRVSSVSTKDSVSTVNKSVKFAAAPVVHYANAGYWDLETIGGGIDSNSMGINLDSMDIDDSFSSYSPDEVSSLAKLRELQCTTPTPEREKAKGLKRLMSLSSKKISSSSGSDTNHNSNTHPSYAHKHPQALGSPRPVISSPYPLGTLPGNTLQSTVSLRSPSQRSRPSDAASSTSDFMLRSSLPLRSAPSCESFRSSKSAATRSVRSLGSMKSTSSPGGIKGWFGRTMGWVES